VTTFPDLDQATAEATGEALTLPIHGKPYTFPMALSIERGLQFHRMREEGRRMVEAAKNNETYEPDEDLTRIVDELDGVELYLDLIGADQLAQMKDDGVDYPTMLHVGTTLYAWYVAGDAVARRVWTRGSLEEGDVRPPAESSANSARPRTSRSSSTKKKPNASKPRRTRGATSSTGGNSSKRTSTGSTT
jgi:hypothetical protein